MEDKDLIKLWKSYDKRLEESLLFNKKNAEDIIKMKIHSFISSMKPLKIFTISVGILWVGFIDILIINLFTVASPFFLISAGIMTLLNKLAIGLYLYQLILIYQVDISKPVLVTQDKLARLKSTTLWVTRIIFLQLPAWTTFYLTKHMLENETIWLHTLQFVVTALFTYLAIWLFFNINYENKDKKWFRLIFNGNEWNPVIKSIEILSEINEYRNENAHPSH